ncbi:VWA domain-containing protein [Flavobacteriaceae bacterium]|nr:VWA domain-containing protein [Flavobacteriaceae bacterium]MDC1492104.1 VWA domain-containing protein [Flavobacteriaceae bacterium]
MYQLEEKIWFWLMIIPILVVVLFLINEYWKTRKQEEFITQLSLIKLSPNYSRFKPSLKMFISIISLILLIIAMVNLQVGSKIETYKRFGIDIVFAIDVSRSMLAEDVAPNRLEKSKQIVNQIINKLTSDRVGIVAYAGKAFPQLPITTDYSSAKMFLNNMNTDMISSQGTAIDQAIQLSSTYFDEEIKTSKLLIIISDGEDHNKSSLDIAKMAGEKGIKIYTIGVGKEKGSPIPMKKNGITQNYKRDNNNEVVITKLNKKVLTDIAQITNGSFISGENTSFVIGEIDKILLDTEKTEFESTKFSDFDDQFQIFIFLALLFLLLDIFLFDSKTSWIKKLNLFNDNNAID